MGGDVLEYLKGIFGAELECETVGGVPVIKCPEDEDWDSLNQKLGDNYHLEPVSGYAFSSEDPLAYVPFPLLKLFGLSGSYKDRLSRMSLGNLVREVGNNAAAVLQMDYDLKAYSGILLDGPCKGLISSRRGYALVPCKATI